jgi:two-component system, sensor histidine kinase PdtaS
MKNVFLNFVISVLVVFHFTALSQHSDSKRIARLKSTLSNKSFSEQTPILFDIANVYLSENKDSVIHYINYLDKNISQESEYKIRLELLKIRQMLFYNEIVKAKKPIENFKKHYLKKCTEEEHIDFNYLEAFYYADIDDEKSLEIANTALNEYGHVSSFRVADIFILKSNQLQALSRYSESIQALENALMIYRKLNSKEQISRTYMFLSYRYIHMKDYDKAHATIQNAIDLKSENKSKIQVIDEYMALGEILYHQSKYEDAIEIFDLAEKENKVLGFWDIYNNTFYYKSLCLYELKQYEKVITSCLAEFNKEYFNEAQRFTINYLLVLNYNELKRFKEAKFYVDQTQQIIENSPFELRDEDLLAFMKVAIQTEKGIGNIHESLKLSEEYIDKYQEYKDSINYVKIAASHTSFEINEKEIEIKDLQIKATSNELKLEKLNNERLLLWILIIFGSSLTGGVLFFMKRLSTKNKTLYHQNEVIEEGKTRIELLLKELHHRTKNNLQLIISMLKIQARNNKYIDVNEFIEVNRNRINSMAMIHQYLYLNDSTNDKISLKNYVEDLINAIKSSFADKENVEIHLTSQNISCDVNIAVAIGLIINELVTNSLKYAFKDSENGNVFVQIVMNENNMIQLNYKDDGVGFETHDIKSGSFGVSLVNLLIAQVQGKVKFENNQGVHYQFDIPASNRE